MFAPPASNDLTRVPTLTRPTFDLPPLADSRDATFGCASREGGLPERIVVYARAAATSGTTSGTRVGTRRTGKAERGGHGLQLRAINRVRAAASIAASDMVHPFVTEGDGALRALPTIFVDSSEFVVSKLKDRGTHPARGVVTNAHDFMHIHRLRAKRDLGVRAARGADSPAGIAR